ncbi:sugar phosphate isomerase/epimerase [Dyadobacter sp. Leaf189]|uniref:sugar phosphate isomerase/epimerase family protein n=1 Tax=Dyadobacter sp. Leaf189 TaxID=1736295 RepID=UPI0006F2D649|nr:sugar phosphate isomerase/epimerase [Dyadobacter sp. Leaf189]KQS31199.1 xylose isomerase [Dyadobacter sp. Leaf189]
MDTNRRQFIASLTGIPVAIASIPAFAGKQEAVKFPLSCNQYSWITFYAREGKDWSANLDASLADFASTGLKAYEPALNNADEVARLLPLLRKYKLEMPSVYVNTSLHEAKEAGTSIESVLAIAGALKPAGTKIVVTNPNPIKWGSNENKSDEQLAEQARNLNKLGTELRKKGMRLAYHTHDVELRAAAREFHHMLLATDPENVSLCLDVHWVYRGSGNSQVALFDVVKLYGKRIVELHIRQSKNGIWQETFGEGDIDYPRLVRELDAQGIKPHLVLEQCLEKTSPKTMNAAEAHKVDMVEAKKVFGI